MPPLLMILLGLLILGGCMALLAMPFLNAAKLLNLLRDQIRARRVRLEADLLRSGK